MIVDSEWMGLSRDVERARLSCFVRPLEVVKIDQFFSNIFVNINDANQKNFDKKNVLIL